MRWATFNQFEFEMPNESINACSHPGPCDDDVEYWHGQIDLSHIPDDMLSSELRRYGVWDDEELADRQENEHRIIWIAARNIQDEDNVVYRALWWGNKSSDP